MAELLHQIQGLVFNVIFSVLNSTLKESGSTFDLHFHT